jgi:non-homologous end joining protein Ku
VKRKAAGEKIEPLKHASDPKVIDLMDALRKSIEQGKRSEPEHRSAAKSKPGKAKKTVASKKAHSSAKRRKAG